MGQEVYTYRPLVEIINTNKKVSSQEETFIFLWHVLEDLNPHREFWTLTFTLLKSAVLPLH